MTQPVQTPATTPPLILKLNDVPSNDLIYVNVNHIVSFKNRMDDTTQHRFMCCVIETTNSTLNVKQTADQIVKML